MNTFTCQITVDKDADRYNGQIDLPDDMDVAEQLAVCGLAIRNIADVMITRLGCPAEAITELVRELVEPSIPPLDVSTYDNPGVAWYYCMRHGEYCPSCNSMGKCDLTAGCPYDPAITTSDHTEIQ
jgi:hypothetical protein